LIVLAIVAVVFVFGVGFWDKAHPHAAPPPDPPDGFSAYTNCRSFAELRLKAPASADFASFDQSRIEARPDGHFVVGSYVDAQNSFGAKIRTAFSCEVHFTDAGSRVVLDSLQME
jgi:hypothetical protein